MIRFGESDASREDRPVSLAVPAASAIAALAAFVLPALDANLPGGSLPWQIVSVALAIAGAGWVVRAGTEGTAQRTRRIARIIAGVAVIAALAWVGGVVFLWLIWPR